MHGRGLRRRPFVANSIGWRLTQPTTITLVLERLFPYAINGGKLVLVKTWGAHDHQNNNLGTVFVHSTDRVSCGTHQALPQPSFPTRRGRGRADAEPLGRSLVAACERPILCPLKIMIEHPNLSVDPRALTRKRIFDLSLTSLLLLAAAPILLTAAAYIRLVSPGPVLFRQDRIGRDGRVFQILKLRTMKYRPEAGGSSTTVRNDPRLIRGGGWLRKYKLDELPQLFNVLSGDMSLVGPRPTVQEDVERMSPVQLQRLLVSPGLTGLAQTRGNTTLNWPERIELDLQYVRFLTLAQDVRIIADTVWQVVRGRADTHPLGDDEWGFPSEPGHCGHP
jgi:undecaprenyl phosphate N,N'-diacetylbacillosamine 1-phosphate transferase